MSRPAVGEIAAGILAAVIVIVTVARVGPRVSRTLLRWAARRCFHTDEQRERFAEEWLADLDDVPGRLAKLAHTAGVLLLAAAPIWVRSRWRRSLLARWRDRAAARPRPGLVMMDAGNGAVLTRAGALALALAVTGLLAAQTVQSILRLHQDPAAPSATSGALPSAWTSWYGSNSTGMAASVTYHTGAQGMQLAVKVVGIPVNTACKLYVIPKNGKPIMGASWTTDYRENTAWYAGRAFITASKIKQFEVTTGPSTPPVWISRSISTIRPGPAGSTPHPQQS